MRKKTDGRNRSMQQNLILTCHLNKMSGPILTAFILHELQHRCVTISVKSGLGYIIPPMLATTTGTHTMLSLITSHEKS